MMVAWAMAMGAHCILQGGRRGSWAQASRPKDAPGLPVTPVAVLTIGRCPLKCTCSLSSQAMPPPLSVNSPSLLNPAETAAQNLEATAETSGTSHGCTATMSHSAPVGLAC